MVHFFLFLFFHSSTLRSLESETPEKLLSAATAITWLQHWSLLLSLSPPPSPRANLHVRTTRTHTFTHAWWPSRSSRSYSISTLSWSPTIFFAFLTIINLTLLPECSGTSSMRGEREHNDIWRSTILQLNSENCVFAQAFNQKLIGIITIELFSEYFFPQVIR